MPNKTLIMLPCAIFFKTGRGSTGIIVLLMQLSVFLWPAAVRMARTHGERSGMQQMLDELANMHSIPRSQRLGWQTKRFRQTI